MVVGQANKNYVLAEYIWIGGQGEIRSKTKVIHGKTSVTLADLSPWNYDGSSTDQAMGNDSEVLMKPCALFKDPFRRYGNNVLVITDTYFPHNGEWIPHPTNSRYLAKEIFDTAPKEEPWFGIEQEYTLFQDGRPFGWPKCNARGLNNDPTLTYGFPGAQGPYYCSNGFDKTFGARAFIEEHLEHCMAAGLTISGINAEVMPAQWEYQVGPCVGVQSGDELTCARYIMNRIGEKYNIVISLHPKPVPGEWNGSGGHVNFSTKAMRSKNGLKKAMIPAILKLGERHEQHINVYGADNNERLVGKHEAPGIESFSYGIADRSASIRVTNDTAIEGKGYFEDRRPASNLDPYVVTSMIFDSAVLDAQFASKFDNIRTDGVDVSYLMAANNLNAPPEPTDEDPAKQYLTPETIEKLKQKTNLNAKPKGTRMKKVEVNRPKGVQGPSPKQKTRKNQGCIIN